MLLGMGGCTAFDVMHILKKSRQEVDDCVAELDATRADTDPKVFTKIHVHYVVKGKNLDKKKVARAVDMTAEKYCSVSIMLAKSVDVTHDFEIIEEQ
jgi:putative redox protein